MKQKLNRPGVLLLIPHLGGGGAEQVTALLAQNLPSTRYDLHLGLITQRRHTAYSSLSMHAHIHCLGARRIRTSALLLLALVWRLRPRLILSTMAHLNFLVLLLRPLFPPRTRVLVRQNGTVSAMLAQDGTPRLTRLLYRNLYARADRVICQTDAMAADLRSCIELGPGHLSVLPNPIDLDAMRASASAQQSNWSGPGPHLLAVGRLSHEKGFDLLLHALYALRAQFPTIDLAIAGAGPEEHALRQLVRLLGLEHRVRLLGSVASPADFFSGATLFVLPSRHEGMPNAMLEAAAAGLPIVATAAGGGVASLLRNQAGVWLAHESSEGALALAISAALRTLPAGARFPHPWVEQFHLDRAIPAYQDLIDATLQTAAR